MRKPHQWEMPVVGDVLSLVVERGDDPWRLDRERWEAAEVQRVARDYESKMQRLLSECPGFTGGDMPRSEQAQGRVIIEPAQIVAATEWLKRRFHVAENIELSDTGICLDVKPRVRRKPGQPAAAKPSFLKPVQFALPL